MTDRPSLLEFGPYRLDGPEAAGLEGGHAPRGAAESGRAPRRARRRGRPGRVEGGAAPPCVAGHVRRGGQSQRERLDPPQGPRGAVRRAPLDPDRRQAGLSFPRRGPGAGGRAAQPRRPAFSLARDGRGRRRARPGHGGRAHHAARGDRPRGGAAHRHGPPLRVGGCRPRGGGAAARGGRGRRRAAPALGLTPAPHRSAGPDRRGSASVGRPLRRGVHAPLRGRGRGRRARGLGPRGGAERGGAPAARPPPDAEPRGLPGLLPRPLLLGPLLPAVGREG